MIVFVGGMTAAGDLLLQPIIREARCRAFKGTFELLKSSLENSATMRPDRRRRLRFPY